MHLTGDENTSVGCDDQLISSRLISRFYSDRNENTWFKTSSLSSSSARWLQPGRTEPLLPSFDKTSLCVVDEKWPDFTFPFSCLFFVQILRFLASKVIDHQMSTQLLIGFVWREKLAHTKNWHRKINQCLETLGHSDSCTWWATAARWANASSWGFILLLVSVRLNCFFIFGVGYVLDWVPIFEKKKKKSVMHISCSGAGSQRESRIYFWRCNKHQRVTICLYDDKLVQVPSFTTENVRSNSQRGLTQRLLNKLLLVLQNGTRHCAVFSVFFPCISASRFRKKAITSKSNCALHLQVTCVHNRTGWPPQTTTQWASVTPRSLSRRRIVFPESVYIFQTPSVLLQELVRFLLCKSHFFFLIASQPGVPVLFQGDTWDFRIE